MQWPSYCALSIQNKSLLRSLCAIWIVGCLVNKQINKLERVRYYILNQLVSLVECYFSLITWVFLVKKKKKALMISWSLPQTALETSGIIADSWQLFEGERYKTQCRLIDPFRLLRFCSVRVSRLAHEWTDGGPMNNVAPAAGCIIIGLLGSESSPNINWADRSLNARSTLLLTSTTASGKKKTQLLLFPSTDTDWKVNTKFQ